MEFSEEELEEVLSIFQEESEEQIQKLNENMLRLEANPQDEKAIQEIFREAHSLKGAARMIGLDDIQTIAHKLEDIFGLARKKELEIRPEIVDIMCRAVDALASIIEDTVKTKGSHSIDVESVVNQLKLIESGQMNLFLDSSPKEEEPPEENEEDEYDIPLSQMSLSGRSSRTTPVPFEEDPPPQKEKVVPKPLAKTEEKPVVVSEDLQDEPEDDSEVFSHEELAELRHIFFIESTQTINFILDCVSKLRQSPYDRELLSESYRNANLLEGSTRIINFYEIKELTYWVRDIFEQATKEEIFINSNILDDLEINLNKVKKIIQKTKDKEGCDENLDIEALQEQIDIKTESYKKKHERPKKVKTQKVSLSSDSLSFDEEEVLKDFGVLKDLEIPEQKPEPVKKQIVVDPLSLSDEELGDLEIGSLKGLVPVVSPENGDYPGVDEPFSLMASTVSSQVRMPSRDSSGEEIPQSLNLRDLLQKLTEDLSLFSHNVNNKALLNKLTDSIVRVKNLAIKENNQVLVAIISKVETIFFEAKENNLVFTTEMAIVMSQSLESAISLVSTDDEDEDIIEDPSLIYQRLMILHQTARLTAGVPFVEEEEPDVFQKVPVKKLASQEEILKAPDDFERKESAPETIREQPKPLQPPQEKQAQLVSRASTPAFAPKKSVSPLGKIDDETEKASDSMETYTIKTLRVDTRKLDQLVAQVGELIIAKIKAKERLADVEKILNIVEDWQRDWAKTKYAVKNTDRKHMKAAFMAEGTSIYTPGRDFHEIVRENSDRIAHLTNHLNALYRSIQEDDTRLTLIISELEEKIKNVRLLPLSTIFNMYPRMIRDLAREQNKEIDLEIRGSETTVDKKIIEEIKSPLMHLIRNAIDHGLEKPEDREKSNKSPVGKVIISARHLENSALIEIIDDGRGINIEAIKIKVLEKELLTPSELAVMTETQIMNIIFWPGFSTSKEITDLSGRGVGMDVVHTKITQLNGKVKVYSKLGEGCKVSIQLPVTMATIQVFLVKIANQTYAIPASAIKTAVLVNSEEIFFKEGRQAILVGGVPVFLTKLSSLLELHSVEEEETKKEKLTVLVIQAEDFNIGFVVDALLGDQEILHKNLEPPLVRVRNVAGVTTLGSGEVCLILNVGDLIKTAQMSHGVALRSAFKKKAEEDSEKQDVLVVDDSVTTRILERNILRAAGYNVTVAVNGLDALTKLATQPFDLVVSDVEMPDISGYELTSRIKRDEMLCHIPVVLVTSLASEVDRQKGLKSGASAYITKGGFDQEELLGTIRKLLS